MLWHLHYSSVYIYYIKTCVILFNSITILNDICQCYKGKEKGERKVNGNGV